MTIRSLFALLVLGWSGLAQAQPSPPVGIVIGTPVIGTCPSGNAIFNNAGVSGCQAFPASTSFANPSAVVGLTAVNGTATTAMRSDAAPALDPTPAYAFPGLGATTISQQGASASALTLTGGTVTTSQPLINATQTWNAGAVMFSGVKFNIINTASNVASSLFEVQEGGSQRLSLRAAGTLVAAPPGGGQGGFAVLVSGETAGRIKLALDATNNGQIEFGAGGSAARDLFISYGGAARTQLGINSATPIGQTLQGPSSRPGTDSNVGGANLTVTPGDGTGTPVTSSALIFAAPLNNATASAAQTQTEVARVQGGAVPSWKWSANNSTGAGSALLGGNSPAVTLTAPYTWVRITTSDGSTGYMPIWK